MKAFIRNFWPQILSVFFTAAIVIATGLGHHPLGWTLPALAMGITFNSIPNNLRVPFFSVEFNNSNASQGSSALPYSVLLVGQKTSAGTAPANSIQPVNGPADVQTFAGQGSMLHRMSGAYFANNKSTQTYIGVLADNGAGVAATGSLLFTGPATAAGTINLYIGAQYVPVGVNSGDSASTIATNVDAAIDVALNLPVSASVASATVSLTALNAGTLGNSIDLRFNYQPGQAFPAGVGCTVTPMASGATNPVLTTLIANMGDNWYHVIAHPYTDATSLTAIENELASRFGPMRMIDGLGITSAYGSNSTLATLGQTRNSSHNCIVAQTGMAPLTPPDEFASEVAGVVAFNASIDPARPFQTLPLTWTLPVLDPASILTLAERNLLLYDGIATTSIGPGEQVQLERIITTYQKNASGAADDSYLDATTMLTLMTLRYTFRNRFRKSYPRHKLAADGTRAGAGQPIVTPSIAKAEAIAWFLQSETDGLVQNFDLFKSNLQVQVNGSNSNRLDFLLPPELIGQLIVGAAQIDFQL